MRLVIQRCKRASVEVDGQVVGRIDAGLTVLVGVTGDDTEKDAQYLADKTAGLRIFEDGDGRMNYSVQDIGGAVLSVSQFTLYGDCRKGRRPNFMAAARPEPALALYEAFNEALRAKGLTVETGTFGAMMDVSLVNWGPVTLIVDSRD
ncbi:MULTISPECIES: D-aminoacyl-tRNA deacylase [Saccharibacillus]|uniref:D-aminoacyl-tRNA deacylase n=1 Tax=Saccharibacillus brassicae TaxID=2583377 RepID=A0A4Y6UTI6_SACBS|nr:MULTISPECIES: D-aminoacyl-tRNA deacylase [Saccharibacillus]MWJ33622.1 D-tyrosyl-tRNA(Tyr) deacylase [Saccharibacillus sp. WB 17]QDH20060.1 D-tyrosyl-tRNA(Tyr) deacylase [Saccharibacillus brassicae]